MRRAGRGRTVRWLGLAFAVAGMPGIALAADSWSISIGVRETGTSAAIGDDGGTSGGIEWVNLDGQSIVADGLWRQYTWNFGADPITNFSGGNGVLSSATMKGVLENIRISNSGGNAGGQINLRVDNIVNTVGGVPTTVTGFETSEGFLTTAASSTPMFREPIFSNSTLSNMSTGLNSTLVSTVAQSGSQSMAARWSFVPDGSTSRWLRLSTASGGGNVQPNPTIDFTSGNSVSMWLRANVVNPTGTRTLGVDVSSNQGTGIDWNRVAAPQTSGGAGLTFAFVRSTRGGTSGTSSTGAMRVDDTQFTYNITNAKAAGLLTGPYHFGRPDMWTAGDASGNGNAAASVGTPEDEARHMLEVAGKYMKVGYMRPVYDLEDGGEEQNNAQMTAFVNRFANTLIKYKGPGAKIIVYAGSSYASQVNSSVAQYPLWMPAWPSDPNPWANDPFASESSYGVWNDGNPSNPLPWSFWQYNSPDVYIPGIGGATGITHNDIDVAHGDVNYVKQFLIQGAIWDGSTSATWATAANWDTNAEPTSTTEILFNPPVPGAGSSIALSSGRAASGLYFAESYTLTGGSLALNDGRIDVDATKSATIATNLATPNGFRKVGTGSLTHSSGTSTVTGIAQVLQGTMSVSGGAIAVSGNLLVNPELTQYDKSLVAPLPTTASQITNSTLTINGGSVNAAAAFVGGSDTASGAIGTLNVSSGSLSVTGAMKIWNSTVPLVNSKVNFSGGLMSLGSLNTDGDVASFNWTGGALTIGGDNSTSTFNAAGSGSASLTKTGTGTLALSGANTYTGGTTVNAGMLSVSGATAKLGSGNVTVLDPGTGAGGGLLILTGVLNAIGDNATLSLAGGGMTDVADVGFASLGAGVNDRIAALVLGGVAQASGLTYGSTASGALLKSDEYFSVGGTGILTVGLTGDFNADGTVNAGDYIVWRKNSATYGGSSGYDLWRLNFGQTASGAGSSEDSLSSAVPEPAPLLLLVLAAASVCFLPHRKVTQVSKVRTFWQAVRP